MPNSSLSGSVCRPLRDIGPNLGMSLNGIFHNGRRVEWAPLTDGDEITIGRHTLFYVDTAKVPAVAGPSVTTD